LEWIDPVYVIIRKIDSRTILIKGAFVWPPFPQNYILIKLNDTKTKAIMTISSDGRAYEFVVREENGRPSIYTSNRARFTELLSQKFGIIWVIEAKIEKIEDGTKIRVSDTETNSLSLTLNDEKTRAILEISDGRTDEFIVKKENDNLNIYDKSTYFDLKIKQEKIKGDNSNIYTESKYFDPHINKKSGKESSELFVKDFSCNNGVFEYSLMDIKEEYGNYKSKGYLFSWDEIPGNDNVKLIEFLRQKFGIDWLRTPKVEKIDLGMIIKISTEKNLLLLKLNNEKTKLFMEINDGRTDEFIAKTENDKLNIYSKDFKINLDRFPKKMHAIPGEYFEPTFHRSNFFFQIESSQEKIERLGKTYGDESQREFYLNLKEFYASLANISTRFYKDIKTKFDGIKYIGPIRDLPKRSYPSGETPNDVGRMGGNAPKMIEAYPMLKRKIQEELKRLDLADALEILEIETQKIFEFKLTTGITKTAINFVDLGCGTSQILPLLIQSLFQNLYSQDKSMVVIEQPEVHLHPKVQADFASFLVESVKSKTKFLIETHSEHFIERIRTHILKNPSIAEDIVIYYVEQNNDKKHSEITKIEINSEGQYSTLPEGYLNNFRSKEIDIQMNLMLEKLEKEIGKNATQ
jgi:hypothetical protein